MRVWDPRVAPFKPVIEFKADTNFATTADMWIPEDGSGDYLATGHRGFNGEGCSVKLWDLRNFSDKAVLTDFQGHEFTPESVCFLRNHEESQPLIISASKDRKLNVLDS